MLDIKFIKEHSDIVRAAIKNKKGEDVDLEEVFALYEKRTELRNAISELNRQKNEAATARDIEKGKQVKGELQDAEETLRGVEKEFVGLMAKIPNIPSPDTPIGDSEDDNKVLRQVGEKPDFSFTPQPHWELGAQLGIIDSERAAEVSGARFTYLKGDLALMQMALLHYTMSVLTSAEKLEQIAESAQLNVDVTPFVPVLPPVMMKSAVMNRMARLHPIDDRYFYEDDDLVLIGSAEHTLGPLHMDEVCAEKDLPIRYVGYSTAFRREAGSYGKDTRGILRQHQFDKIEMETFTVGEKSLSEQDFLVAIQEAMMQKLGIPYQVVLVCTGDMGKPDHRQLDIEAWMPGQDAYRETHSADLMGSYQARRLNARVKREDGKVESMHMNDATAFAMGRTLIAIMENNQQEDGSIMIPEVLQPYMGGKTVITKAS